MEFYKPLTSHQSLKCYKEKNILIIVKNKRMKASEKIQWLYRKKTNFQEDVDDHESIIAMFNSIIDYLDEKEI